MYQVIHIGIFTNQEYALWIYVSAKVRLGVTWQVQLSNDDLSTEYLSFQFGGERRKTWPDNGPVYFVDLVRVFPCRLHRAPGFRISLGPYRHTVAASHADLFIIRAYVCSFSPFLFLCTRVHSINCTNK